jgi:hypothetical protein
MLTGRLQENVSLVARRVIEDGLVTANLAGQPLALVHMSIVHMSMVTERRPPYQFPKSGYTILYPRPGQWHS